MYITISSIKKTLGKYIEMTDLYIGFPMFVIFLILFGFTNYRLEAVVFLSICAFLMTPVNLSKKNRMYKVLIMCLNYLFRNKNFIYFKNR